MCVWFRTSRYLFKVVWTPQCVFGSVQAGIFLRWLGPLSVCLVPYKQVSFSGGLDPSVCVWFRTSRYLFKVVWTPQCVFGSVQAGIFLRWFGPPSVFGSVQAGIFLMWFGPLSVCLVPYKQVSF